MSGGHVVVYIAMDQVGWFAIAGPPGRLYWGACSSTSSANHPILSLRQIPYFAMDGPVGCVRVGLLPEGCTVVAVTPFFHVVAATFPFLRPPSALRRHFYRLLRRRSVWVVGTCCTRPWHQGTCVRSEQLATVPSWTVRLSSSPATLRSGEQDAEGRLGRDGCVAGARQTPGRTNTGGECTYFAASHTLFPSASADLQG